MISAKEAKDYADEVAIAARQCEEYPILIGDIERVIVRAQFNNRLDSPLYAKIKNDLIEAGYEVDEDFSPASIYYWIIKWNKEDDGYDFI